MNVVYVSPEFACLFILPIIIFCLMIRDFYFDLSTCIAVYFVLQLLLCMSARYLYS